MNAPTALYPRPIPCRPCPRPRAGFSGGGLLTALLGPTVGCDRGPADIGDANVSKPDGDIAEDVENVPGSTASGEAGPKFDIGSGDANDDDNPGPKFDIAEPGSDEAFPDWDRLDIRDPDHCLIPDNDACAGFPDSINAGFAEGKILRNYVFLDCQGNKREFAEFLSERPDNGLYNKGFVIALGAGWCVPCLDQSADLAGMASEYRQKQIDIVYLLHEGAAVGADPTTETCQGWADSSTPNHENEVWFDPENEIDEQMKVQPNDELTYTLLVDANAHARMRRGAPVPSPTELGAAIDEIVANPYGDG
ncbi:MAG: hypothetical protein V3V08_24365 [Nannocystaceae bacterium]